MDPGKRVTIPQILVHGWMRDEHNDSEDGEGEDPEEEEKEEDDVDFKEIAGNINYVNVDNLFYTNDYKVKLSYTNYCCITEDFTTKQLNEEAIKTVESFGFPRSFILSSIQEGFINQATASYFLLVS